VWTVWQGETREGAAWKAPPGRRRLEGAAWKAGGVQHDFDFDFDFDFDLEEGSGNLTSK